MVYNKAAGQRSDVALVNLSCPMSLHVHIRTLL